MAAPLRPLWAVVKTIGRGVIALLILFEEWGWTPLARALGRLARWPAVALLPVKIGALWLVGLGRVAIGLALLVGAKLLGTAVVARLFQLTQPQLMKLGWFARAYARWVAWKTRVIAGLVESPAWIAARGLVARVRARWTPR